MGMRMRMRVGTAFGWLAGSVAQVVFLVRGLWGTHGTDGRSLSGGLRFERKGVSGVLTPVLPTTTTTTSYYSLPKILS
ncbi:hypothetical protein IWZ03DRAFT_383537 [Phyllosticta citriasiana]|uniref:Secreted protein n=1 Tax=Phyllosticta citriasiana TaxID=595635 RepID=A0ABR1KHX8_9PEZI